MEEKSRKAPRPHQLNEGTILNDRYRIDGVLGQGGFGITYQGVDLTLELEVAVKEYFPGGIATRHTETSSKVETLDPDDDTQYNKGKMDFLKEARTLARFQDDAGIVSVKDFFEENNTVYIVMELLRGTDLRTMIRGTGQLPFSSLFALLTPVMESLEKIHAYGVIHRDVSPSNIMVLKDGRAKLLDFGAARAVVPGKEATLSVLLKPGFSPIEQYLSKGKQGPWTDVYALCATMYFCLTGMLPEDSQQRLLLDELKKPSELGMDVPARIEEVLMKGLSIRAEDRWQSVAELRQALGNADDSVSDYIYHTVSSLGLSSDHTYCFAFRKEDEELEKAFSGAVRALVQSGTYDKIAVKYPEIYDHYRLKAEDTDKSSLPESGSGDSSYTFRYGLLNPDSNDEIRNKFAVELCKAVCEYMGWGFKTIDMSNRGACDCISIRNGSAFNRRNTAICRPSINYTVEKLGIFATREKSTTNLKGKVVGVRTKAAEDISEEIKNTVRELTVYDDYTSMCSDLKAGKLDAILETEYYADFYLDRKILE